MNRTWISGLIISTLGLASCASNTEYFAPQTGQVVASSFNGAMQKACERHRATNTLTPAWLQYCKDNHW